MTHTYTTLQKLHCKQKRPLIFFSLKVCFYKFRGNEHFDLLFVYIYIFFFFFATLFSILNFKAPCWEHVRGVLWLAPADLPYVRQTKNLQWIFFWILKISVILKHVTKILLSFHRTTHVSYMEGTLFLTAWESEARSFRQWSNKHQPHQSSLRKPKRRPSVSIKWYQILFLRAISLNPLITFSGYHKLLEMSCCQIIHTAMPHNECNGS